jgi:uncharacterized protein YlzI (FlbEa/FlbD family)
MQSHVLLYSLLNSSQEEIEKFPDTIKTLISDLKNIIENGINSLSETSNLDRQVDTLTEDVIYFIFQTFDIIDKHKNNGLEELESLIGSQFTKDLLKTVETNLNSTQSVSLRQYFDICYNPQNNILNPEKFLLLYKNFSKIIIYSIVIDYIKRNNIKQDYKLFNKQLAKISKSFSKEVNTINREFNRVKIVENIIKNFDTYPTYQDIYKKVSRRISEQNFKNIMKFLEKSNKILYDKDNTIIWIFADNKKSKQALKQSTTVG